MNNNLYSYNLIYTVLPKEENRKYKTGKNIKYICIKWKNIIQ